ncbi:unnamed protein product [Ambrosiozyma monospora]|uniref:Unnamed protein product n=1 Tax=Ambrosiozyma monospora TaxID=43982 RepID=A0A9W7DFL8_AMBMO|nr:unnamed protein product [Ambrosiozyma monospora]
MSVSPSEYDQLISTVSMELDQLQSHQKFTFPVTVKFSGIRLLLSQDSKKIFVCLMIKRDGVGENICKMISSFNNFIDSYLEQQQTYDSELMHCSIGQLLIRREVSDVALECFKAYKLDYEDKLILDGVFVTNGRKVDKV